MPPTKPTDSTKDAVVNAIMKFWEKDRWMSVRSVFQLHNEEAADRVVNSVRNKFAHIQPKDSKGRESVVPEVASPQDFDRHMEKRGERAFSELNGILIEYVVKPPTLVDPETTTQ